MTPERHARLMALFDESCELGRPEAKAFLAALAETDHDLRAPLEAMLDVDQRSQVFFDQTQGAGAGLLARDILDSALGTAPSERGHVGAPPQTIGEYEVLERVGSGGMGSVFRARQQHPDRVVALKTLHPWLVSPAALDRFRFEAQALASLKHPSIPPVYTVGQHEGAVYFAMELVAGPTLLEWANQKRLSTRARVELLERICDAVHHAHLRGLVHRDLKPDNIRVPDDGIPRVLDFGIAAGLGGTSVEVAGTPAYMSPEQVQPGAPVDVRSDVFSLGVIGYELLAGRLPAEPPKSGLATLQAFKLTPAPRLSVAKAGLGELDDVVAMALAVDPDRRYASAADLGAELRRYLEVRPVRAYRGGAWYRFRKLVRRNALASLAIAALFIAVSVGLAVSLLQYREAVVARDQAAAEAKRVQGTLDFVSSLLSQADPEKGKGRDATIGAALDRAAAQVAAKKLDPKVQSGVRRVLAETYMGLGEWKQAEQQAIAALKVYDDAKLEDDELLSQVLLLASQVHHEAGNSELANATGRRAIDVEQHVHGTVEHAHVTYAMHVHAVGLREAGHLAEALALHEKGVGLERILAVKTGVTEDLADALNQWAVSLVVMGRFAEAELKYREALALDLKQFGPEHHEIATDYHHLAWLENERDNPGEALKWLDKALAIRLKVLGKDHTRVGIQRNLEALVQLALGNVEAAEAASDECLRIAEAAFGKNHPRYTRMSQTRVLIRVAQGRAAEAVELGKAILDFHVERYGATQWITEGSRSDYAQALFAAGQRDEALAEMTEVVKVFSEQLGEAPKATRDARKRLAAMQKP